MSISVGDKIWYIRGYGDNQIPATAEVIRIWEPTRDCQGRADLSDGASVSLGIVRDHKPVLVEKKDDMGTYHVWE